MTRVVASVPVAVGLAAMLAAPPTNNSSILGVWRGKMDSLPAITLTIEDEGGKLSGAVLFYLIRRNPGGRAKRVTRSAGAAHQTDLRWQYTRLRGEPSLRSSAADVERSARQVPAAAYWPQQR